MARRVIGLDVGSFSVKVAHLETHGHMYRLVACAEKKLSEFEGEIEAQQAAALAALDAEGMLDGGMIVTGLAGVEAQVRSVEVPFTNAKKIEAVLGGMLDAQLPLEMDDLVLSWFLQPPVEGKPHEILVAFSRKESISHLLEFLKAQRADPRILTHKSAALIHLLQNVLQKRELGTVLAALVDVGHQSTGICIGSATRLIAARTVLRGGANSVTAIARELRQTFLSLEAQGQAKVERVFLVGGASQAPDFDRTLSELLGRPVECLLDLNITSPEAAVGPAGALSISYGILGHVPVKQQNRFDFRKGDFAFRGQTKWLEGRSKPVAIWATAAIMLLLLHGGLKNWVVGKEERELKTRELSACQKVIGKSVDSGANCLAMIKRQISGQTQLGIPQMSAADFYLELARVIPSSMPIKITDLDLSDTKLRIEAETNGFETIDQIVVELSKAKCIQNIEKGRARQSQDVIQFQLTADLNCDKVKAKG